MSLGGAPMVEIRHDRDHRVSQYCLILISRDNAIMH